MRALGTWGLLILALVFWPWALGLVDCGWWAVTGATLSGIPWFGDAGRGWLLIVWPIVGVVLGFLGLVLLTL